MTAVLRYLMQSWKMFAQGLWQAALKQVSVFFLPFLIFNSPALPPRTSAGLWSCCWSHSRRCQAKLRLSQSEEDFNSRVNQASLPVASTAASSCNSSFRHVALEQRPTGARQLLSPWYPTSQSPQPRPSCSEPRVPPVSDRAGPC